MIMLGRVSRCRRYFSDMPDISHPKWSRREKLSEMNFANKGKGRFRVMKSLQMNTKDAPRPQQQERLPSKKTRLNFSDDKLPSQYYSIYQSISAPFSSLQRAQQNIQDGFAPFDGSYIQQEKQNGDASLLRTDSDISLLSADQNTQTITDSMITTQVMDISSQSVLNNLKNAVENGQKIDVSDVNNLMDVYANENDLQMVTKLYGQLMTGQDIKLQNGISLGVLQADIKSYGIVIKCLANNGMAHDAFKIYDLLKTRIKTDHSLTGYIPRQIYSSLIKACTRANDVSRAIGVFEHFKSSGLQHSADGASGVGNAALHIKERPDAIMYQQIIHACAKSGQVERAFSYFDEMLRSVDESGRALVPLQSTFNALIHACAKNVRSSSKFGFRKAFELSEVMQEVYGMKLDVVSFEYLLMACGQQGDVRRAKALILQMESDAIPVRQQAVLWTLNAYSQSPALITQLHQYQKLYKRRLEFDQEQFKSQIGLLNSQRFEQGTRPIDVSEWMLDGSDYQVDRKLENNDQSDQLGHDLVQLQNYILDGHQEAGRISRLFEEGQQMFDHYLTQSSQVNTHLLNGYLNFLGEYCQKKKVMQAYQSLYDQHQCHKDINTYGRVMQHWFRSKVVFNDQADNNDEDLIERKQLVEFALSVYKDYEQYRQKSSYPSRWTLLKDKNKKVEYGNLGIGQVEQLKEYNLMKNLILGLTKCDEQKIAMKLLKQLADRRHFVDRSKDPLLYKVSQLLTRNHKL
ncbi:hypothetical protein MP228_011406 [Amoeboaphelidium protococcarum]|nr:hypothetical protein MP228_011406 [Amoeboaphelidium protococcarum]